MSINSGAAPLGAAGVEGRRRWAATLERAGAPITGRMIELAELSPGDRVLDIATGAGDPAIPAARVVGAEGGVIGIDTMELLLAFARERAHEAGLRNISFVTMDAHEISFPPGSFDAVFCKFGLMFLRDYGAVVDASFRVLDTGGWFVASLWGAAAHVPAISITMDVLQEQLDIRPAGSSPHPFALADSSMVLKRVAEAGFTQVHVEPAPVIFEFRSPEQYMHYMHDVAHQVNLIFQEITPAERTAIWDAIVERASRYITPEGIVRFENEATIVVGRRGV